MKLFGGASNRRITALKRSPLVWVGDRVAAAARRLVGVVKVLAVMAALVGALYAARLAVGHVVASPRFSVREIRVGPTLHASNDELVALSEVAEGDRLLAVDTDAVAARLARHPWVLAARVRRELPGTLVVEITERRAAALAVVGGEGGGLYLVDEAGRPFKRATPDEAEGLVVLTGISRAQYAVLPAVGEAAFREALALLIQYRSVPRPVLSEIHIAPRSGFSLFLYEGGGEIRLGRGGYAEKLGRLDEIFRALGRDGPRAVAALRAVHLDGPAQDRVPIRLAAAPEPTAPPQEGGATK